MNDLSVSLTRKPNERPDQGWGSPLGGDGGVMTWEGAERLSRALSYEGYVLYPYRRTLLKNQRRWAFGTLYPRAFCREANERCHLRTEFVVCGEAPLLRIGVRFLHPIRRVDSPGEAPWFEAMERSVELELEGNEAGSETRRPFEFQGATWEEASIGRHQEVVRGHIECSAVELEPGVFRIAVEVSNDSTLRGTTVERDEVYLRSLAAAHVLVACEGGEFTSCLEPPRKVESYVARCRNEGVFPVLVGPEGSRNTLLSSPVILYDYPQIAPESPSDSGDPLLALHGVEGARHSPDEEALLTPGDRVIIRPRGGGDVWDLVLSDERGTVCGVEQDLEGRYHYAITIDSDPGSDLGEHGQPGHRFFFDGDELEVVS